MTLNFFCRVSGALTALSLTIASTPTSSLAQDQLRVPVLTTQFGAGTFEQIVAFERLVADRYPALRLVAQESPGYVYNLNEMTRKESREETTLAMSSTGAIWAARSGQEGFFPKPLATDNLRWVMTRSANCLWFISTDADVKTVADFSGKNIGMGLRSQTHPGLFATRMIETGGGVTDANLEYLGDGPSMTALADGKIDIAPVVATMTADGDIVLPSGSLRRFQSSGREYHNINFPPDLVEKVNAELGAPFEALTIPAGTFPQQDKDIECLADYTVMISHKNFPESAAFEVTKTLTEIGTDVAKYIGAGKLYRPETMCTPPVGLEPHPGAVRACKESGLGQ
nr:TAXI family TRAP transporter solute-binding subunit [uncultured Roseovarius sp.]